MMYRAKVVKDAVTDPSADHENVLQDGPRVYRPGGMGEPVETVVSEMNISGWFQHSLLLSLQLWSSLQKLQT